MRSKKHFWRKRPVKWPHIYERCVLMKISLDGVQETLLIPLWARAVETSRSDPIITDQYAVSMIESIAYDFSKFKSAWMSQLGVSIRTMLIDKALKDFMYRNDKSVIINIGAGLDTRFMRLSQSYKHWYDIDLPDVIELRRRFFSDSGNYTMLATSVYDYSWVDAIRSDGSPVMIIAEGVLMYFEEDEVGSLFRNLIDFFPGAEMIFDILAPFLVNRAKQHDSVKYTSAKFKWGIQGGQAVEAFSPSIRFIEEWNYYDYYPRRWRWFRFPVMIPAVRRLLNNCIVHTAFQK